MPTVQERYQAATDYVRKAVATVETQNVGYTLDPVTGIAEWYAGRTKTAPVRDELSRIEDRWKKASGDERAKIASDAEGLADRTQESLPGAPQDRKRTNLYKGEKPTATAATSYEKEVGKQAGDVAHWASDKAGGLLDGITGISKWLLVGGAVFTGWKLIDYLGKREGRNADAVERQLNANLARAAEDRNAFGSLPHAYSVRLTAGELRALENLRQYFESAEIFLDTLKPLGLLAEHALAGVFPDRHGSFDFHILASDVWRTLEATRDDGGGYGTIPGLESEEIARVLAREADAHNSTEHAS
jgi:hypothetical protein